MVTIIQLLQARLTHALRAAGLPDEEPPQVSGTADPRHGDYQSNAAMILGKKRKENPRALATTIVESLDLQGICTTPEIAGPGFINFRLLPEFVAGRLIAIAQDERLGIDPVQDPEKLVIEFSSPNIAKPMHIGHIRS